MDSIGIESEADDVTNKFYIDALKRYSKKFAYKIKNYNPSTDMLEVNIGSFDIHSSPTCCGKNNKKVKKKLTRRDLISYDQRAGSTSMKMVQTKALAMVHHPQGALI